MEKIDYSNLPGWIADRLEPFRKSKALLDQYCARSGDDFALLDACIHLSNLSTEQIEKVGKAHISPSCWYTMVVLADEGEAFFDAGIKVAKEHGGKGLVGGGEPLVVKLRSVLDRKKKGAYTPADLKSAVTIAKKYSVLTPKGISALASMAAQLSRNGVLSPKQIGYIGSLLTQMRSARVAGSSAAEQDVMRRLYALID